MQIGDYVAYTPDSAEPYTISREICGWLDQEISQELSLNWRVLNINNDGTVDLISDEPTNQDITFADNQGYNNGVFLLNDITATQYSNSRLGATARSLNIEDIEKNMSTNAINNIQDYSNAVRYNYTITYSGMKRYPNIYAKENGSGIDTQTVLENGINPNDSYELTTSGYGDSHTNTMLTMRQTYYELDVNSDDYNNSIYYNLFNTSDKEYWLASRYVNCCSDKAEYGIRNISDNKITGYFLSTTTYPTQEAAAWGLALRPVVSLKANIRLNTEGGNDGSSPSTAYQLAD